MQEVIVSKIENFQFNVNSFSVQAELYRACYAVDVCLQKWNVESMVVEFTAEGHNVPITLTRHV